MAPRLKSRRVILDMIRGVVEDHGLEPEELVRLLELTSEEMLDLLPNRFYEYSHAFLLYKEDEEDEE